MAKTKPMAKTKAKAIRKRSDCTLTVHFDSEEMRGAFFGWFSDGGRQQDFLSAARETLGVLSTDIECEAPDKVFVGDMDVV